MTEGNAIQQTAESYKWVSDKIEALNPIPEIHNPATSAIDSGLDSLVEKALEASGLMGLLEQVTGMPSELTAAAKEWQAQAKAMQQVAAELRRGGSALAEHWEGEASAAFGAHMGLIVEAIDGTAADMNQAAGTLSQAAAEAKLAEELVVGIIREAIEWLLVTIAAGIVVDILTLGLATAAEALVVEGEMVVFIARVERVSVQLAGQLRELRKLIQEMRDLKKAGKAWEAVKKAQEARKAISLIRTGGRTWYNPTTYLNPFKSPTASSAAWRAARPRA